MTGQDFRKQTVSVGDKVLTMTGYASSNDLLGEFEVVQIKQIMKPFKNYQIGTILFVLKEIPTISHNGTLMAFHSQNVYRTANQIVKA